MWIFTGSHNLRHEDGTLVEPFVPFDCSTQWRDSFGRTSAIGRRIMTVADYEKRIRLWDLKALINECRRRKLPPRPADTADVQWILRPQNAVTELAAGRGEVLVHRYGVDKDRVLELPLKDGMKRIVRTVTDWLLDDLEMTAEEFRSALVDTLMAPIRDVIPQQVSSSAGEKNAQEEAPADEGLDPDSLSIDERRELVRKMRLEKRTLGDIAETLDVSVSTIQRDLNAVGA